ncbi:ABC transporter substrate-binding protein [Desulfovibrio inopinatus]|uniref:ABC transporter substrate-binding protein n=1 Tax=Desulfovibrio inopinatus TaxID=102109 RepID=UPI00040E448E|nr:ABC transporter substrate-binding protein [Desulfovibrio inopinatus]
MQDRSIFSMLEIWSAGRRARRSSHRTSKKKFWLGIAALFLGGWIVVAPLQANAGQNEELDRFTLQLKWLHQFQFAGYYAAKEHGYYQDVGIDLVIKEGGPGIDPIEEVTSGRADFGVAGPELLLRYLEGSPVVVLAAIFQHSPSALISLSESYLSTPHDLVGKKLMLSQSGEADIWAMLSNEGITAKDFRLITTTWDVTELIDHHVDAMASYSTNTPYLLEKQGVSYSLMRPSSYGVDFYGDCLFTSKVQAQDETEMTKRFLEASLKGWEYAFAHEQEVIDLLLDVYRSSKSREHLVFEAKALRELVMPNLIQLGHINAGRWQYMANTYAALGMASPKQVISGFLFDAESSESRRLNLALRALGGALAGVAAVLIWLYLFNHRLKAAVKQRTEELNRLNHDMSAEIIERKRTGQQLLESEERLRTLINTIPDFVCLKDEDGRWLLANEAALRLFGLSVDMYQGKTDGELAKMIPTFTAVFNESRQDDEQAWSWKRLIRAEVTLPVGDDGKAVFDVIRVPLYSHDGEKKGLIIIGREITERKRFEEALRESNKVTSVLYKIANVVGASANQDVHTLMSGVHDVLQQALPAKNIALGVLNHATDQLEFLYFVDELDAPPAPIEHISHSLQASKHDIIESRDALITVLRSTEPLLFTKAVMHLTGMSPPGTTPEFWLSVPLKAGDRIIGLLWLKSYESSEYFSHKDVAFMNAVADQISMGILRHQVTEDLRQAKEDAVLANCAKSNFLASMSHEIRTPLNAIVGLTDLLARSCLDTSQKDYVETIRDSADHLLGIISDILDFSKIEARKMELEQIDFDLTSLLASVHKTISLEAGKKGLAFNITIHPDTPTLLCGDPGRLRQILVNLMGNAVKFTEHGRIEVRAEPDSGEFVGSLGIHFSVSDTGVGIGDDIKGSIFESFKQADDSTTRKYGGTGLGLSISKQLVELMHGHIGVESTVGEGSTFHVTLPFEPGDANKFASQLLECAPEDAENQMHFHLLIVEDNPINVKVAKAHLALLGHKLTVAENGLEAIKALSKTSFDAVLMDIEMPEMDGLTATKYIRQGGFGELRVRNTDIPIVAMTAHVTTNIKEQCRDVGMDGHMGKPINFEHLTRLLSKLLSNGNDGFIEDDSKHIEQTDAVLLDKSEAAARLGIDEDEFERIFHASLKEMQTRIGAIEAALATGTLENISINAHALKSTCAVIGAETCRSLSHALEKASKNNNHTELPDLFDQLRKAITSIFASIDQ